MFHLKIKKMGNLAKNIIEQLNVTHNNEVRNMPILEGQTYHFVVPQTVAEAKEFIVDNGTWDGIRTNEGMILSTSSLTRNGNGLGLQASDVRGRIVEICEHADANHVVALRVLKVYTRTGFNEQGQPQARNYYTFAYA